MEQTIANEGHFSGVKWSITVDYALNRGTGNEMLKVSWSEDVDHSKETRESFRRFQSDAALH